MFIREKKSKDKTKSVIQIVENQRVGDTTKQWVLRHVGTGHNADEIEQLKRIAALIKQELENEAINKNKQPSPRFAAKVGQLKKSSKKHLIDINNLEEKARYVLGIHDVYGYIYDHLGFTNLFTRPRQREEAAKILREIVLVRIANPLSKRASVNLLEEQFGISLNLDAVYQMMDKIDSTFIERIQQRALDETLKLTGEKLRVLFYDATTLYFESFTEDDLKQNGYSKDMKFNQPQVLLALFVTEKGLPVGYELFPGSTFEGHTLIPVLERLKERYQLEEVVFVADQGLFNEDNLTALEEKGFKYVVGARIKNVSNTLKEQILNSDNYQDIHIHFESTKKRKDNHQQRLATFEYRKKRQLIVHYSSRRAYKDEHDRNKAIDKLYKKISKSKDPKSLLNNYGYKKYLEIQGEANILINEAKIKEAARWDGLLGVVTNIKDKNPEPLLVHYRSLWQIEESFRINKHDLKMCPIYHWTPKRIKAHIAISFIAFVCVRYLEYLVATISPKKLSPASIRQSLLQVQASVIEDSDSHKTFLLSSPLSAHAKEIYRVVGIKLPTGTAEIQCGA